MGRHDTAGVHEQLTGRRDAAHRPCGWLSYLAAGGKIPIAPRVALGRREKAACGARTAQRGDEPIKSFDSGDVCGEPPCIRQIGRAYVEPESDGQPLRRGAAPPRLDENAHELPAIEIYAVRPLH